MPEVTVLTAVKDGEKFLAETIESIIKQSFHDWEYIIVNDNSTDSTNDIILEFIAKEPRIRKIDLRDSKGPFGAANIGLKKSRGRYIVRTDADDISVPNRIEEQIRFLKSNSNIRACATYGKLIDSDSKETGYKFRYPQNPNVLKWYLSLHCPLIHSSLCIEKSAIIELGGYKDLPASQDYRMFTDISRKNWLSVLDEDLVLFRDHSYRLSKTALKRKQIHFAHEIIQDHLFGLVGQKWTLNETEALYSAGLGDRFSIPKGVKALNNWAKLWQADLGISAKESEELMQVYIAKKRKFMKKNRRQQPVAFMMNIIDYFK